MIEGLPGILGVEGKIPVLEHSVGSTEAELPILVLLLLLHPAFH